MSLIVADASALVEYLLNTSAAPSMGVAVRRSDVEIWIPALCDVEVTAALRRALITKILTVRRATAAIQDYLDLPLRRAGHLLHLERVLELRQNFSAYDAFYVALAEWLQAALITADSHLVRAIKSHTDVTVLT